LNRALPGRNLVHRGRYAFAEEASVYDDSGVSVEINDHETGASYCFIIDLDTADVEKICDDTAAMSAFGN
jgi:hypothetical protein